MFAALVTALGQAWADFDVYMPGCWATDPQRRKKAGIPEKLAFATKPELAIAQAKRLMAAGLRVTWAAATAASRLPAQAWNASCPGTPHPPTWAPGPSHPPHD